MTSQIDNSEDLIDVRDIIERYEELQAELEGLEEAGEMLPADDIVELDDLKTLLGDLEGRGGDHQWLGNWYPVTLIRYSYFTEYCKELVEDCYDLPKDMPTWIEIDWEKTADNLKVDYEETDFDGVTYFYR